MAERRGPWNSLSQIVGRIEDLEAAVAALEDLDWQDSVLSRFDPSSGLPGSPSDGDRYVSTATANGWTNNNIYEYDLASTSWVETVADEGMATYVEDEDIIYVYNGSAWVTIGSVINVTCLKHLGSDRVCAYLRGFNFHGSPDGLSIRDGRVRFSDTPDVMIIESLWPSADLVLKAENAANTSQHRILYGNPDAGTELFFNDNQVFETISGGGMFTLNGSTGLEITISGGDVVTLENTISTGDMIFKSDDIIRFENTDQFMVRVNSIDQLVVDDNGITLRNGASVDTIETTLTDDDTHVPTSGAVVDAISAATGVMAGQMAVANAATTVTVTFGAAEPDTNYYPTVTLENTTDSPPSIYGMVISGKTVNGFTVTFSGAMDSANYKLNWHSNR